MKKTCPEVTVVGAGLAGCEAAWKIAEAGIPVVLCEMKPQRFSPAHRSEHLAELVCSNSLKAERPGSAGGLIKAEMRRLGSLLLQCADETRVPAGGALAVDRDLFSQAVTRRILQHPLIRLERSERTGIPEGPVIIASGPLTSDAFANAICEYLGTESLSFYDAASPIITYESLDRDKVFFAARYDRGEADYINCPFDKEEYERFHEALCSAQTAPLHDFDRPNVYEACMPIEVMAGRGPDTLRFGPLRPVGLRDPRTGHRPWAAVQLRKENREGTLYNLVGFQTNLRFPEQKRVFCMIPGLEQAEFVRYGVMHRNTFLDSPRLFHSSFALRKEPRIFFAGQITGVEGYMESAASGILAGINMVRFLRDMPALRLPPETMTGALTRYISDSSVVDFQPMGANMGLLPPLEQRIKGKQQRYEALAQRSLTLLDEALERQMMTTAADEMRSSME